MSSLKLSGVNEYALGASSSMQNLYEITRNRKNVLESDFIVTESNVNDSYCLSDGEMSIKQIVEIIDDYYYQLSLFGKKTVVILLPIYRWHDRVESLEEISIVNDRHRYNASLYGFYIVDFPSELTKHSDEDIKLLIPDVRHLNQALLHNLAISLVDYFDQDFKHCSELISNMPVNSGYKHVSSRDLFSLDSEECKSNSRFKEHCVTVDRSLVIDEKYKGFEIIGLGLWSDTESSFVISNGECEVVKGSTALNSFVELINPLVIHDDTVFKPNYEGKQVTEKTMNLRRGVYVNPARVTGVLVRKRGVSHTDISGVERGCINLNSLIPSLFPYIASAKSLIDKGGYKKDSELTPTIDYIRDLAISLEDKYLSISYELMKKAAQLRPSGILIKNKLKKYAELSSSKISQE